MDPFSLTIRSNNRIYNMLVKQIYLSDQIEKFEISAKNRSIILQSNRPLLRGKGLKKKAIDWKILSEYKNASAIAELILMVEQHLRTLDDIQPRSGHALL